MGKVIPDRRPKTPWNVTVLLFGGWGARRFEVTSREAAAGLRQTFMENGVMVTTEKGEEFWPPHMITKITVEPA